MALKRRNTAPQKIYVQVNSDIGISGFMTPKSILWRDGRIFKIDSISDYRPAIGEAETLPGDRYTVDINGKTRYLYFESGAKMHPICFGRWFVLVNN